MCGISGIVYNNTKKQTEKFKNSADLQSHRGPDYSGYFGDDVIDLVHHRLSIIDLDKRSNQPFTSLNKERVLVYNGEIYNYKDLIKSYNLTVNTTSDTEVLFKLMSNSNFDIKELNGIFAFALYDVNKSRLQLFRDRLGVKPLYYYHDDEIFIFASEAKVIYSFLDNLNINYQALSEYLTFGHSNSEQTIISGVKKLTPGCFLTFDIKNFKLDINKFWAVEDLVNHQIKPSYKEAQKHAKSLLLSAVERQCISDVSVGAYLSGGIDSSAVVALASKYTDKKLNTYSVNFDKNPISELKSASKIAKRYSTNHHEFEVNTKNIDSFLPKLIYQYDEPFADPAMIPLHLMAEKASNFSKVVLQGDGGDEVFAGYGRHLDLKQLKFRKLSFSILKNLPLSSKKREHYSNRFETLNASDASRLMAQLVQSDLSKTFNEFTNASIKSNLINTTPIEGYIRSNQRFNKLPLMQRMLYTDMENILPNKYLEKVDKVNMLHSIEARVPLLDDELVNYVMRLPQSLKIKKSVTKFFFRDLLKDLVPGEILNDRKRSFGTPIEQWLKTSLYDYALHQFEEGEKMGLPLNFNLIVNDLKNLKKGVNPSRSGLIWRFLVLTIWLSFYNDKLRFN
jgi:asparagine synthase (glutamine-hydrolysing)